MRFANILRAKRDVLVAAVAIGCTLGASAVGIVRAERASGDATCSRASGYCLYWNNTGRGAGIFGSANAGDGVHGTTSATNGASGAAGIVNTTVSCVCPGADGQSPAGTGVYGTATSAGSAGVEGKVTNGWGVFATSEASSSSGPYAALEARGGHSSTVILRAKNTATGGTCEIDASADLSCTGSITAAAFYVQRHDPLGRSIIAHLSMALAPAEEDSGSGQLHDGTATVRLDPAFVASATGIYHVLLAPRGDTRGLYVAFATPSQVVVREAAAGHSNAVFDYRIVATPFASANLRSGLLPAPAHVDPKMRLVVRDAAPHFRATRLAATKPDSSCDSLNPCASYTNTGTGGALEGEATGNNGIEGYLAPTMTNTASSGLFGWNGGSGHGLYGRSSNGPGVYGTTTATGSFGVGGISTLGSGVVAESADTTGTYSSLYIQGDSSSTALFLGENTNTGDKCTIDASADLSCTGGVIGSAVRGTYVDAAGRSVATYAAESASATIETDGTGRLSGGSCVVALDPHFAAAIDASNTYHVFLTPRGETRGLYVSAKWPGAFTVRELQGGRSTLAFDYRIVAQQGPSDAVHRYGRVIGSAVRGVHEPGFSSLRAQ